MLQTSPCVKKGNIPTPVILMKQLNITANLLNSLWKLLSFHTETNFIALDIYWFIVVYIISCSIDNIWF